MPTFEEVYASHAAEYDALIQREDYQHNILKALSEITLFEGKIAVDMGTGTGRLIRLLAPKVQKLWAFDASAHMLSIAQGMVDAQGWKHVTLQVADNRSLPLEDAQVDLVLEGWSFGHATDWFGDQWRPEVKTMVDEMFRVLKPLGVAILLETLGTGSETPVAPSPKLDEFYHWLETELGFQRKTIRTDYQFVDMAEAEKLSRFFFGDTLADQVVANQWQILPENTGIWWKVKPEEG